MPSINTPSIVPPNRSRLAPPSVLAKERDTTKRVDSNSNPGIGASGITTVTNGSLSKSINGYGCAKTPSSLKISANGRLAGSLIPLAKSGGSVQLANGRASRLATCTASSTGNSKPPSEPDSKMTASTAIKTTTTSSSSRSGDDSAMSTSCSQETIKSGTPSRGIMTIGKDESEAVSFKDKIAALEREEDALLAGLKKKLEDSSAARRDINQFKKVAKPAPLPPSTDLLAVMCQLMNHVNQIKRQNNGLKEQVRSLGNQIKKQTSQLPPTRPSSPDPVCSSCGSHSWGSGLSPNSPCDPQDPSPTYRPAPLARSARFLFKENPVDKFGLSTSATALSLSHVMERVKSSVFRSDRSSCGLSLAQRLPKNFSSSSFTSTNSVDPNVMTVTGVLRQDKNGNAITNNVPKWTLEDAENNADPTVNIESKDTADQDSNKFVPPAQESGMYVCWTLKPKPHSDVNDEMQSSFASNQSVGCKKSSSATKHELSAEPPSPVAAPEPPRVVVCRPSSSSDPSPDRSSSLEPAEAKESLKPCRGKAASLPRTKAPKSKANSNFLQVPSFRTPSRPSTVGNNNGTNTAAGVKMMSNSDSSDADNPIFSEVELPYCRGRLPPATAVDAAGTNSSGDFQRRTASSCNDGSAALRPIRGRSGYAPSPTSPLSPSNDRSADLSEQSKPLASPRASAASPSSPNRFWSKFNFSRKKDQIQATSHPVLRKPVADYILDAERPFSAAGKNVGLCMSSSMYSDGEYPVLQLGMDDKGTSPTTSDNYEVILPGSPLGPLQTSMTSSSHSRTSRGSGAVLKKRKRKISESDSLASSEYGSQSIWKNNDAVGVKQKESGAQVAQKSSKSTVTCTGLRINPFDQSSPELPSRNRWGFKSRQPKLAKQSFNETNGAISSENHAPIVPKKPDFCPPSTPLNARRGVQLPEIPNIRELSGKPHSPGFLEAGTEHPIGQAGILSDIPETPRGAHHREFRGLPSPRQKAAHLSSVIKAKLRKSHSRSSCSDLDDIIGGRTGTPSGRRVSCSPGGIVGRLSPETDAAGLDQDSQSWLGRDDGSGFTLNSATDSVFTSHETGLNKQGGLLKHVMLLQDRNSRLIHELHDKTKEYTSITSQLEQMEKEIAALRNRHRFDSNLASVYSNSLAAGGWVPCGMVVDLETKMKHMEEGFRTFKTKHHQEQEENANHHARAQAMSWKCLEDIEGLQRDKLSLLRPVAAAIHQARPGQLVPRSAGFVGISCPTTCSSDTHYGHHLASTANIPQDTSIRDLLDELPTFDALYSFALNLLKTIRFMRTRFEEKTRCCSQLDLELLHTQSSLLLAHAQIQRQNLELRFYTCANGQRGLMVRRTHSWHGQSLIGRWVDEELSFFLPFKLLGNRAAQLLHQPRSPLFPPGDAPWNSPILPESALTITSVENTDKLEQEFLRLFKPGELSSSDGHPRKPREGDGGLAGSDPDQPQSSFSSSASSSTGYGHYCSNSQPSNASLRPKHLSTAPTKLQSASPSDDYRHFGVPGASNNGEPPEWMETSCGASEASSHNNVSALLRNKRQSQGLSGLSNTKAGRTPRPPPIYESVPLHPSLTCLSSPAPPDPFACHQRPTSCFEPSSTRDPRIQAIQFADDDSPSGEDRGFGGRISQSSVEMSSVIREECGSESSEDVRERCGAGVHQSSPPPIYLGNRGQVRAIAAAFNSSAPASPLVRTSATGSTAVKSTPVSRDCSKPNSPISMRSKIYDILPRHLDPRIDGIKARKHDPVNYRNPHENVGVRAALPGSTSPNISAGAKSQDAIPVVCKACPASMEPRIIPKLNEGRGVVSSRLPTAVSGGASNNVWHFSDSYGKAIETNGKTLALKEASPSGSEEEKAATLPTKMTTSQTASSNASDLTSSGGGSRWSILGRHVHQPHNPKNLFGWSKSKSNTPVAGSGGVTSSSVRTGLSAGTGHLPADRLSSQHIESTMLADRKVTGPVQWRANNERSPGAEITTTTSEQPEKRRSWIQKLSRSKLSK